MFVSRVAQRFVRKTQNQRNFSADTDTMIDFYETAVQAFLSPLTSLGAICGIYDGYCRNSENGYCRNSENGFRFLNIFSSTVSGALFGLGVSVSFPVSIPLLIIYQFNIK